MKRFLAVLLISACILMIVACNSNSGEWEDSNPYFKGKVVEVYDKGCLVEVTDVGNGHFWVGNIVQVHTDIPNCPEYTVGDVLLISFDGKVAESYPPQVTTVLAVVLEKE